MTPESLIKENFRLLEPQKKALAKLGLEKIDDLLHYFPTRYGNSASVQNIESLTEKTDATIFGTIKKIKAGKTFRGRMPIAEATITDGTNTIRAIWFHQPYIAKLFLEGTNVRLDGKIGKKNKRGQFTITNPKIERIDHLPVVAKDALFVDEIDNKLFPVYPETRGLTSNWLYHAMQRIFSSGMLEKIEDPIPAEILEKYHLPGLKTALIWIHTPQKESDALAARKRFAFEEIFLIQLYKQRERHFISHLNSYRIEAPSTEIEKFISKFPFQLTGSQEKSIAQILADIKKDTPMSRLLEGDVGSGKTAVSAVAVFAAFQSKMQTAYMAPTEILAKQHFEGFIKFFEGMNVKIGLLTGSGCRKFPSKVSPRESTPISKAQLLKWVKTGEISILIGTHALIQKSVEFKNVALVIIDEQHRFGTKQRQKLARKDNFIPHLLSMTATPIPRTLSLTIYGDLDLSLLDQMPAGRRPIITEIVTPGERENVYEKIRAEIHAGRQAYVICPRIDEPDPEKEFAIQAKSVRAEADRLRTDIFPDFNIEILHSKMTPAEKNKIMADFEQHKIDILVSTSVIEVGINVPNATNIIIEGAERFGLAQLHQLRGRVLRSNHQAYCYVFTDSRSEQTVNRLGALIRARNGFELAEYDLKLRGAGELLGGRQWGISDLGMEAIKNLKMVEAARNEATLLIEQNPDLDGLPILREKIVLSEKIHFE